MPAQGNSTVATPQFVFAVTKGNIGTAVGWTGQQIAEALADPQLHSHVNMVRAETDPDKQKVLKEEKKYEVLGICPHFFGFRNNHRAAAEALPECCTYETCVDVDDPAYGKQAIEGALRLNQEPGMWRDKVLYIENSLRGGNGEGKCHIWLKQPLGMTAVETQQAFCKALGIPCDDAVQQKQSFILMTGDAVYQSPLWLQPLTQQEIEARQETFHRRGLSIDGWDKLDASKPTTTPTAAPVNTQNTETAVESANERTRYIVGECLKETGLSVDDLNEEGGRHNTVKAILSVGVTQLLTEREFLGVMQEMAPAYSQEQEFRQLVSDFYAKYTDASQKMTQFQRRVFAKSRKLRQATKAAQTAAADHEEPTAVVYGDTAPLADIYSSPQPSRLSN